MTKTDGAITQPVEAGSTLRFPTYSVAGQAGTSFKPEHLAAIAAEAGPQGFFEVHAENYMGAGGPPIARWKEYAATTRYRCTASVCRSAAPSRSTRSICGVSRASSTATSR